ncbi:hypothetical protein D9M73_193090 [compost metagenome]
MLVRPAADIARFGRLGRLAGIECQPLHHAAVGRDPAQRRRAVGHADTQPVVVAPVHFHHFVALARPDFESVRVALLADGLEGLAALAGDEAALGGFGPGGEGRTETDKAREQGHERGFHADSWQGMAGAGSTPARQVRRRPGP